MVTGVGSAGGWHFGGILGSVVVLIKICGHEVFEGEGVPFEFGAVDEIPDARLFHRFVTSK